TFIGGFAINTTLVANNCIVPQGQKERRTSIRSALPPMTELSAEVAGAREEYVVMVRITLYSEDRKLQQILSSALGRDFQIMIERTEDRIHMMLAAGECDVVL